ncbi:MAG TPA: hypothetical protein VK934_06775, partial [Fimbriimonas sp.]|nr:hypothetical protein [Fimbriimonas sp.]
WEGESGYGRGEKPLKKVRLGDKMGWHNVSLPKRRYPEGLMLRFTGLSGARTDDIALSELQLLKNDKPVDLAPSKVVAFTGGSECG